MLMWHLSIVSLILAAICAVGSVVGHAVGLLSAPVTVCIAFAGAIFVAGGWLQHLDIQIGGSR